MNDYLLLVEDGNGYSYYVGPLAPAKALALADLSGGEIRTVSLESGGVRIYLLEDGFETAWGSGETEEQAWRYALGAMFGPLDENYDAEALRESLSVHGPTAHTAESP